MIFVFPLHVLMVGGLVIVSFFPFCLCLYIDESKNVVCVSISFPEQLLYRFLSARQVFRGDIVDATSVRPPTIFRFGSITRKPFNSFQQTLADIYQILPCAIYGFLAINFSIFIETICTFKRWECVCWRGERWISFSEHNLKSVKDSSSKNLVHVLTKGCSGAFC